MSGFIWDTDPVLLNFGIVQARWYGLFFGLAFICGFYLMLFFFKKENENPKDLDSLFIYMVVGTLLGARLGHCLFYDPGYYFSNPFKIIAVWEGGLASHGGGIGILTAVYLYKKKYNYSFIKLLDMLCIPTALGGFFIRMGNFFNSEILGKPSDLPWAIIFKRIDSIPRHPAQLYESFSYFCIFITLLAFYFILKKKMGSGLFLGLFLLLIFCVRFLIEFVKIRQAAYYSGVFTTGQLLSIPFILAGIYFIWSSRNRNIY